MNLESEPIANPQFPEFLAREVERLPAERKLVENGPFDAYLAAAKEIPLVLYEIGRLREEAFRAVGEGTGRAIDLDPFDVHYLHLFLWDREKRAVAGAYRLGLVDEILATRGAGGLYTATLFTYRPEILAHLSPALELGRSFVRLEYQKTYSALLLLWRGIGEFLARNPRYRRLLGAVSISADYDERSRRLMVGVLRRHYRLLPWSSQVRARRPPRFADFDTGADADLAELERRVTEIERGERGMPVLLRQYLKLGGKLLGFNVDPTFANALDGLMVVDLLGTDPRLLERYLGRAGAVSYLAFHEARRAERRASA
ncbi:MAG: GNAT family N-acetyltransferase [Candidatus Binatia bacterium]